MVINKGALLTQTQSWVSLVMVINNGALLTHTQALVTIGALTILRH